MKLDGNDENLLIARIRFAAIKVSNGDKKQFFAAVEQAKKDWRDLLMWAEFENPDAHHSWANAIL